MEGNEACSMRNILIVNDDGYYSYGIKLLYEKLKKYGNCYVFAPAEAKSGASHSFDVKGPFVVENLEENIYKAYASPADCVRLALDILDIKFDLVFSGINDGLNLGDDIMYSGTCHAALEGIIGGIPSVAISTDKDSFEICENEIDQILELVFDKELYSNQYVLNINFPTRDFKKSKGIKLTKQGIKRFKTSFYKNDLDGKYYVKGEKITYDSNKDTDSCLSLEGYITITLISTHSNDLKNYEKIEKKLNH